MLSGKKKKILRISMLLLIFTGAFVQYQTRAPKRNFSDFHVPYTVGGKLLDGEEIYSYEEGLSYFKYPPFYANLMVPLSCLPERAAASIWYILNLFFLVILFHCSRRIIVPDDRRYDSFLLYLFTAVLMFRAILQNMHEGQANIFMFTLLTLGLFFYVNERKLRAGFFIAFSVMIKYMTIFFLPYFLIIRKIKVIFFAFLSVLLLHLVPALAFGFQQNIMLIKKQLNFMFASSLDPYSIYCYPNQSLISCISRFFWKESPYEIHILHLDTIWIWTIFLCCSLVLYYLAIYPVFKKNLQHEVKDLRWKHCLDWGLIFIFVALVNPNGWKNFYISLFFPYMVIVYYLLKVKFKDKLITTLLVISFILFSLASEFFVYGWAKDSFEVYSSITFGALVLFITVLILKIRHRKGMQCHLGVE